MQLRLSLANDCSTAALGLCGGAAKGKAQEVGRPRWPGRKPNFAPKAGVEKPESWQRREKKSGFGTVINCSS